MGYQNYEDETVDSRGILIARINHIAEGLSLPALMEAVQEMKAIEAWQHRPRAETTPPLSEVSDRNPREIELADKIRRYLKDGSL